MQVNFLSSLLSFVSNFRAWVISSSTFLLPFNRVYSFFGLHDLHLSASLFVRLVDELLPELLYGFLDEFFVVMQRYGLEIDLVVPVFGENVMVKELSRKCEAVDVFQSEVDIATSLFVDDVVVRNNLITLLFSRYLEIPLMNLVGHLVHCESCEAAGNEIQFCNFLALVIKDLVRLAGAIESPRNQPLR